MTRLDELPGGVMVLQGLADLRSGTISPAACLVAVASQRLRDLGLDLPESACLPAEPELTLYELLSTRADDGYYRYNAGLRELDSFLESLEGRFTVAACRPTLTGS